MENLFSRVVEQFVKSVHDLDPRPKLALFTGLGGNW